MSPDQVPAAKPWQILLFLSFGTKGEDRVLNAPHLGIHSKNQSIIPAAIAQPFHDQHRGQDVCPAASIFLRCGQPQDPHLGTLLPIFARELTLPVAID